MAKKANKKTFAEMYEDIGQIFNTVGGSISEEEDGRIYDAIIKHESTFEEKIKLVLQYARDLERGIHYTRR